MNEIHDRLEKIARDVFDDGCLVLDARTRASDVPGWDSLGHVNFMLAIEAAFGIQLTEDEFIGFDDIGGLESMITEKVAIA